VTEPGEADELRARLRRAEEDAIAARTLAGGADRDTAEFRSELREFRTETRAEFADVRSEMRAEFADVRSEMRAEFTDVRSEMRAEFVDVRAEVGELRTEFREYRTQNNGVLNALREDLVDQREEMNRGFAEVRGKFDGVSAFLQVIADRLGGEEEGDDRSPAS
jgi:hypothetical protein